MFDVIIAAAGESTRFGNTNKLTANLHGITVLESAVRPFLAVDGLEKLIIATSPALFDEISDVVKRICPNAVIVLGGSSRTQTIKNALAYVDAPYVLIHDGARPFVTAEIIKGVLENTVSTGACVPTCPLVDSIADVSNGYVPKDRANFRCIQTPQGFDSAKIKSAYAEISADYYDDASVFLTKYENVSLFESNPSNKKITTSDDLLIPVCRSGIGFDTHKFAEGRKLILGGVNIPHTLGLLGHSDADVLAHALSDALLSAAGKRDIGYYFPDTDDTFKDADSMKLLERVVTMLRKDGYAVGNAAVTVLLEKPKLSGYIPQMIENLSRVLGTDENFVSVLATTTEGMYETGRGEAASALATVTIIKQ